MIFNLRVIPVGLVDTLRHTAKACLFFSFRSFCTIWILGLLFCAFFFAPAVHAVDVLEVVRASDTERGKTLFDGSETASLGIETSEYNYSPRTKTTESFSELTGRWHPRWQGSFLEAKADPQFIFLLPPAHFETFVDSPEAYLATRRSESGTGMQALVGRKLVHWNYLDEDWRLGAWQPRYRRDYLNPEEVGLTGVFLHYETPMVSFVGFGSGIFVPERGVNVDAQDGQLVSSSPFFFSPPTQITVLNEATPVHYDLQVPALARIILHPSVGFKARVGGAAGFWGAAAYAYQPINQLLLSYGDGGQLQLGAGGQGDQVNVPITPRVIYHSLASTELGYTDRRWGVVLSSLLDQPGADPVTGDGTFQQVSRAWLLSPSLQWMPQGNAGDRPLRISASYLRVWTQDAPDLSADPTLGIQSSGGSVFESRFPYQNAFKLAGESGLPRAAREFLGSWSDGFSAGSEFIRDVGHRGAILSVDLRYRLAQATGSWQWGLGADVLGSEESDAPGAASDFISRYRASDRVRAGMSYVF